LDDNERMGTTSVTSKGQVTIPLSLRKQLGIRQGSKLEFKLVRDHIEVRVAAAPAAIKAPGFGLVKSRRAAVPADWDPASLLK
jgi:AbrB family looped-hinge helix DNA binding protein